MIPETEMIGVLLVDKPAGRSSFAMVRAVRKIVGIKKVGHAGTLDPFATGLLVVCIGRPATRLISSFMDGDKEYLATLKLGSVSSTQDPEGQITEKMPSFYFDAATIDEVLGRYIGRIRQQPPMYSALKHKGKPLYHYARRGIKVEKEPREVKVHSIEWLGREGSVDDAHPYLSLRVCCGRGTYIRTLAADIGERLGCGAYLTELRRTRSGFFSIDESVEGCRFSEGQARELIQNAIISVEDVDNMLQ